MATTHPPFTLVPATREDIPRLSEIHVLACLPDNAFKLYFDSAAEFDRRVREMLQGQVGRTTWTHVKAIDTATGTLAAWASWCEPHDTQLQEAETKARAAAAKPPSNEGEFDFPPGLPAFVQADTDRWLQRWTRRRRHLQCKALFTDPRFERRGMGTALVQHGNQLADKRGLPIFLQGSPYGYPIYEKNGFETVQYLDVDLREWAPDAKRNDKGFGRYRFRYMLRLPETLPPIEDGGVPTTGAKREGK